MTTHATGRFEVKSWDEKPYHEVENGPKLTRVSVTESFDGDIQGEGSTEYLMTYRDDGSASFVFVWLITGQIGGRLGSFVLQGTGTFENGVAKGAWLVVQGSGTGDLRRLRGVGGFATLDATSAEITLDYDFE